MEKKKETGTVKTQTFAQFRAKMRALQFTDAEIRDMWPKVSQRPEPNPKPAQARKSESDTEPVKVTIGEKVTPYQKAQRAFALNVDDLMTNASVVAICRTVLNSVGDTLTDEEGLAMLCAALDAARRLRNMNY